MKKILLSLGLLTCMYANAQTVIVEEKFEKDDIPTGQYFLSNSDNFLIFKGKRIKFTVASSIKNIFAYDSKGNKSTFLSNVTLYLSDFSNTEKTFKSYDATSISFNAKSYYYVNGKVVGTGFASDLEKARKCFYGDSFTDKFELGITNEDKNADIKLEKNALYLETIDFIKRKTKRVKLETLDISRLTGDNLIKPEEKIGFKCKLNKDDSFDIITKSISKDYSSTILYRTTYNLLGKKINDVPFKLELSNKFFLYSYNGGGDIGKTTKLIYATSGTGQKGEGVFTDDLSINNFVEDKETGDVYIYGLYGDKAYKLNNLAKPVGYYVFKFDKKGNKIWESINELKKDKYDKFSTRFMVRFRKIKNDYCFYFLHDRNLNYGIIESKSGKLLKTNVIDFGGNYGNLTGTGYLTAQYDIKDIKRKNFDIEGLIALDINTKFSEYIKSLDPKIDTDFNIYFREQGIYVIESDNKKYYKVTLFEY